MSEEQLKAFIAKVQADPSLQEQLKAEGADVVAIAKAAGFSITTEDLKADHQLTEKELESVAGATGGGCDVTNQSMLPGKEHATWDMGIAACLPCNQIGLISTEIPRGARRSS